MSNRRKNEWWHRSVPVIYPQTYLSLAGERGAEPDSILRDAGLPADLLANPRAEISFLQMKALVDKVLERTGDDGIGVEVGWRLPPTAFGNLGYGLLCSATLQDALDLCLRFWHLPGRVVRASLSRSGATCTIDFVLIAPVPEPNHHLILESTLASLYRGFQLLAGASAADLEVWFQGPPPAYADRVSARLGQVRYNMPATQFRFSAHLLQTPLPMHNPTGLIFAIQQCEREESLLNEIENPIREKVRRNLVLGSGGYPSLQKMSEILSMTTRTLRRRLEEEGIQYKTMVEETKRRDAVRLLDDEVMEIQQVAQLLGYQDPANFTRAFRQWTGQTPSQYRVTRHVSR